MINSNQKGKRGEREFAKVLNKYFPNSSRRSQQYCGEGGDADLICDALPQFHFEVKRTEAFNYKKAFSQAEEGSKAKIAKLVAKEGSKSSHGLTIIPLVVHRYSKKKWMAVIEAEELLRIIKENEEFVKFSEMALTP